MKKKWISMLALCFASSLGATGCFAIPGETVSSRNDGWVSQDSQLPGEEQPSEMTEEEIFQAIKAGIDATREYKGAYTLTSINSQTMGEETMVRSIQATGDPAARQFALIADGEDGRSEEKVFEKDGAYYEYAYDTMLAAEKEGYVGFGRRLSKNRATAVCKEYGPAPFVEDENVVTLANDFAEFTAAYDTVAANSLTKSKANQADAEGAHAVTVSQEGGKYLLTIAIETNYLGDYYEYEDDDIEAARDVNLTMQYTVDNGKLSQLAYMATLSYVMGEQTQSMQLTQTLNYSYEFNQALYDSVNPNAVVEYDNEKQLTFYYLGTSATVTRNIGETETVAQVFAEMQPSLHVETKEGVDYTIDGWYLDEACTQKFDPDSASMEEFFELEQVYAKGVSVTEGYAMIIERIEDEDKYSRAYQIVEGSIVMFGRSGSMMKYPWYEIAGTEIALEQERRDEIRINGEKTEASSFVCESCKVYVIRLIEHFTDEDYNLFDLI